MAGRDLRGGIFRDGLGAAKQGPKSGRRTPRRRIWLMAQPRPGASVRQGHTFYAAATEEGVSADSLSPVASVSGQAEDPSLPDKELYRVQAGAYREREYAENLLSLLENDGFPAYIIYHDGLYKVQIGAYARLSNAIAMEREVREKGYNTYITTC